MTRETFDEIISKEALYSFDGLIKVTLKDGTSHEAVWILGVPPLGQSVDGKFHGLKEEYNLFFVFDRNEFAVWSYDEIEEMVCLQQNYLK